MKKRHLQKDAWNIFCSMTVKGPVLLKSVYFPICMVPDRDFFYHPKLKEYKLLLPFLHKKSGNSLEVLPLLFQHLFGAQRLVFQKLK
jgi:hypothetical protein